MNGYYRRTIKIDTTKWCYTIGEGMGLNATFYVKGYIDVSERVGGGWNARVSARALASNITPGPIPTVLIYPIIPGRSQVPKRLFNAARTVPRFI